ncbi:hypothetical protein [Virgibacillus byunsanensis]|uniref:hypothetical protein n=1 Tax=Virgibacillus byunsanensis TaxID=570945 RepID=UPI0036F3A372
MGKTKDIGPVTLSKKPDPSLWLKNHNLAKAISEVSWSQFRTMGIQSEIVRKRSRYRSQKLCLVLLIGINKK